MGGPRRPRWCWWQSLQSSFASILCCFNCWFLRNLICDEFNPQPSHPRNLPKEQPLVVGCQQTTNLTIIKVIRFYPPPPPDKMPNGFGRFIGIFSFVDFLFFLMHHFFFEFYDFLSFIYRSFFCLQFGNNLLLILGHPKKFGKV